ISLLNKQLSEAGLKVEFFDSKDKFLSPSDSDTLFKIISLGADVTDPVVLFGLMRGKSPLAPHYPPKDAEYENLYTIAESATSLDAKVLALKSLSQYVYDHHFVVPLFERRSLFGINPQRVKDVGKQDGGLVFLVNRVNLKRSQ
ncbi:MAG: hypothetical protein H6620_09930, partial [Halobacteriovoraceae bacterium]|nr:hypothetical protein [Halobacteriovoraceae bacterium]